MDDDPLIHKFHKGGRVRVAQSVILYHTPMGRGKPVDVQGMEGTVKQVILYLDGAPISATRPVQVVFTEPRKFVCHFEPRELEVADDADGQGESGQ